MSEVAEFRSDVSAWIAKICPDVAKGPGQMANGTNEIQANIIVKRVPGLPE